MYSYITNVLFVCRLCKYSFQTIDDFIEHKKEEHSVEFRTSNCIMFEDILILNTNNNDRGRPNSMLSTVTTKNESGVSCSKKNPNVLVAEIENNLTNVDLDLSYRTQHIKHDLKADTFHSFPVSTYDYQQDGITHEYTGYQDCDEAYDNILQENEENHDDIITADSIQVSPDVSLNCTANETEFKVFESDLKLNRMALVNLLPLPQNPYVLLKKLSLTEIQNYSRHHQDQDTNKQVEVTPDSQCQCKLCLKKFNSEVELKIHCRVCILGTNNKKRYCSHCNKFFSTTYARNFHMIRYHGTEEERRNLPKFNCSICQKQYNQKLSLDYHMESHKNKNERILPFKCAQCSASFFMKSKLTRHEATHTLTRPSFQCPEGCENSFKFNSHLRDHLKNIHSNILELFQCPESNCTSIYKYKKGLTAHFRMCHEEIKIIP